MSDGLVWLSSSSSMARDVPSESLHPMLVHNAVERLICSGPAGSGGIALGMTVLPSSLLLVLLDDAFERSVRRDVTSPGGVALGGVVCSRLWALQWAALAGWNSCPGGDLDRPKTKGLKARGDGAYAPLRSDSLIEAVRSMVPSGCYRVYRLA